MGPHHRISVLIRRDTKEPPSSFSLSPSLSLSLHTHTHIHTHTHTHTHTGQAMWGCRKKAAIYKPGGKPSPGTKLSRTVRNRFLLYKPEPVVFCYSSPSRLRHLCFLEVSWPRPLFLPGPPTFCPPLQPPTLESASWCRIFSNSSTQCVIGGIARGPHWWWQQQQQGPGHLDATLRIGMCFLGLK